MRTPICVAIMLVYVCRSLIVRLNFLNLMSLRCGSCGGGTDDSTEPGSLVDREAMHAGKDRKMNDKNIAKYSSLSMAIDIS